MPANTPMNVVLCWHMHQPEYRDLKSRIVHLPWTYLHAIKDYVDMAAQLEARPEARAVINFAPILLEQIEDYCEQLKSYLAGQGAIHDPVLAALGEPALPGNLQARLRLMQDCLRSNRERMIARFPAYERLAVMAEWYQEHPDSLIYASNQFLGDLLTWYHLSWMAESVRLEDTRIQRLQDKELNFSLHDRRELLAVILDLMEGIIPRYRRLADSGQIELTMSPYSHPILPLLLDMNSAREAMPDVPLPINTHYPGGEQRTRWQLQKGEEVFHRCFGRKPAGLWPSEGGISQRTVELAAEHGFKWIASGGAVLQNSELEEDHDCRHRLYRFGDAEIDCLFRDDGLSDLIGFTYSDWHATDAVGNLVSHMENIAEVCPDRPNCAITIILDGENAWEHYPENGFHFLSELYSTLTEHPMLHLTTPKQFLAERAPEPLRGAKLVAGSWVYGTFSTWIGDHDKNRGWELLVEAKQAFDIRIASGELNPEEIQAAEQQLAICEGSDWFWWFGDYNPADTVSKFDQLYRMHLANLYLALKVEPPHYLGDVISRGGGHPSRGGVMRHHSDGSIN